MLCASLSPIAIGNERPPAESPNITYGPPSWSIPTLATSTLTPSESAARLQAHPARIAHKPTDTAHHAVKDLPDLSIRLTPDAAMLKMIAQRWKNFRQGSSRRGAEIARNQVKFPGPGPCGIGSHDIDRAEAGAKRGDSLRESFAHERLGDHCTTG